MWPHEAVFSSGADRSLGEAATLSLAVVRNVAAEECEGVARSQALPPAAQDCPLPPEDGQRLSG